MKAVTTITVPELSGTTSVHVVHPVYSYANRGAAIYTALYWIL
jgi:hypothetical protein